MVARVFSLSSSTVRVLSQTENSRAAHEKGLYSKKPTAGCGAVRYQEMIPGFPVVIVEKSSQDMWCQ